MARRVADYHAVTSHPFSVHPLNARDPLLAAALLAAAAAGVGVFVRAKKERIAE